jgi:hypothetical protein
VSGKSVAVTTNCRCSAKLHVGASVCGARGSERPAAAGPLRRTFQLKRRLRADVTHCPQIIGRVT